MSELIIQDLTQGVYFFYLMSRRLAELAQRNPGGAPSA
jgi:hypothetical protein